jgi:hypothetical protein
MFEVLNAIVFSISIGIMIGYGPGIYIALCKPIRKLYAGDALQIGIGVGWAATALVFMFLWWFRIMDKDTFVIDHELNVFSRWMLITAGFMHLAASGAVPTYVNGEQRLMVPLRSYVRAGKLTAMGILLGVLVVMYIEPWLEAS